MTEGIRTHIRAVLTRTNERTHARTHIHTKIIVIDLAQFDDVPNHVWSAIWLFTHVYPGIEFISTTFELIRFVWL